MLGTYRTTLAEVCAALGRTGPYWAALGRVGAVTGRRGGVRVADRAVLEDHACESYSILRERFDALYSGPIRGGRQVAWALSGHGLPFLAVHAAFCALYTGHREATRLFLRK